MLGMPTWACSGGRVFKKVEGRWFSSHVLSGEEMGWLEEKPPLRLAFRAREGVGGWLAKKRPPLSCVSSKGGSRGGAWQRNDPPPSCVSSKGGR